MTNELPIIPIVAGPFVFVSAGPGLWVHNGPDGERLFELHKTVDPNNDDDWGIWSVVEEDWAHDTTGYVTLAQASDAFATWCKDNL